MGFDILKYFSLILTALTIVSCTHKIEHICLKCFSETDTFKESTNEIIWRLNYKINDEILCSIHSKSVTHNILNKSVDLGDSSLITFGPNYYFCDSESGNLCFFRGHNRYPNKFKCQVSSFDEENVFEINWLALSKFFQF